MEVDVEMEFLRFNATKMHILLFLVVGIFHCVWVKILPV